MATTDAQERNAIEVVLPGTQIDSGPSGHTVLGIDVSDDQPFDHVVVELRLPDRVPIPPKTGMIRQGRGE